VAHIFERVLAKNHTQNCTVTQEKTSFSTKNLATLFIAAFKNCLYNSKPDRKIHPAGRMSEINYVASMPIIQQ